MDPTPPRENEPAPAQQPQSRYLRFWRRCGGRACRATFASATQLTGWENDRDLDIIFAPLDGKYRDTQTEYQTLINVYGIPEDFVLERDQGVTHSFGRRLAPGALETLWMHFLAGSPQNDTPDRQPGWLKMGFLLSWLPKAQPSSTPPDPEAAVLRVAYAVRLIVFQPPVELARRLVRFVQDDAWTDATVDPYVLVDISLVSWYQRVDKAAWEVTNLIRTNEEDIFRRARMLRSRIESTVTDLDLHQIHTNAKNTIFMVEALDAAIRVVDAVLSNHESLDNRGGNLVWANTHQLLRHRHELFHSTRLRTVSCEARIKNTVDLAFHINTAHDSQTNLENSRSVRLISVIGLVFIPFSAINSIFGTQFFTSDDQHMRINPDFWVMWIIAVPVTLISLAAWRATERDQLKWPPGCARLSPERWWPKVQKWARKSSGRGIMSEEIALGNVGTQMV